MAKKVIGFFILLMLLMSVELTSDMRDAQDLVVPLSYYEQSHGYSLKVDVGTPP
jgi:hypothetical protein